MSYYLQDNPNPNFAQFGWPRKKVSGVIGVHTTESGVIPSGPDGGAENTARFIGRRTDPGSYHTLGDADSRIKLVHPRFAAWADTTNNAHAMSVSGAMDAARWRDITPERAGAITRNMAYAAAELVQDATAAGLMSSPTPARRITPAEAIAGTKAGFYGHGETNPGRRYDPGQNFDWDLFLSTYAAAVGGITTQGTITPTATQEWDDMASKEDIKEAFREVAKEGQAGRDLAWFTWREHLLPGWNGDVSAAARIAGTDQAVNDIRSQLGAQNGMIAGLVGALAAINKGEPFDEATLLAGVQAAAAAGVKDAIESITVTVKDGK